MIPTRQLAVLAWRESRTARRRLLLYMSSISIGVAALVAIDSFSANVTRSVHEQARAISGGDLSISGTAAFRPSAEVVLDSLHLTGIDIARSVTLGSMAYLPRSGSTRLVQIHAVGAGYPLYGEITTQPAAAWGSIQLGNTVVVDPSLLVSLNAKVGDTLALGSSRFVIAGALEHVPGDLGISAAVGPRVYISTPALVATGLVVFGSRIEYEALLKLPTATSPDRVAAQLTALLARDSLRVRTAGYAEQRLSSAVDNLHDFLGVVGLVALLLGGIGVASGVHAFVMRKIDTVAVLRCLGATSGQVLFIYVSQAAAMGAVGALLGAALGIGLQFAMPLALADFLPLGVSLHLVPASIGLGVAIGVWVAISFALLPLVALRLVSPLQALRRDVDGARSRRLDPVQIIVVIATVAGLVALCLERADTPLGGLAFSGGIAGAIVVLYASAGLLSWGARRLAGPRLLFPVRQGIAALYRPGNQTRSVILALGFGGFLMGSLSQVQHNLLRGLGTRLDQARANVAFFDVQADQRAGLDSILTASRAEIIDRAPVVRMRISAINGHPARDSLATASGPGRAGWALRREYNSTYRGSLTDAERVVAGRWFSGRAPGDLPEISVDSSLARQLQLQLGDTITWNVQGADIVTRVKSFRDIKWASFEPNFFVVFSPGVLEHAPTQWVVLAHAPTSADVARLQRDAVVRFPTVSSLDLTLVQRTIGEVIDRVTLAIRFLALLSLGLSIPVLFSAVSATRRQRVHEGVLLKTLGATRRQVGQILLAEYVLLGGLGALSGVILSSVGAWALLRWVFSVGFVPAIGAGLAIPAGMIIVSATIGLMTGRDVFAATPMAALRDL